MNKRFSIRKHILRWIFPLIGAVACIGICICLWQLAIAARQEAASEGLPTLDEPLFSMPGGFYENSFLLSMSAPEGCQIYYTLDGTLPNRDSIREDGSAQGCLLYQNPISVSAGASVSEAISHWMTTGERSSVQNAFIIRAIAVNERGEFSKVSTATYFVGADDLSSQTIVSLVTEPDSLFGDQGIYTNYEERGPEWERECNFELFEQGLHINQPAGIRIQGASARQEYAKRFSVYARKEYGGSKLFDGPVFDSYPIHAFVLREGFLNAFIQHLIQNRDIASADAKECLVFVNGCFWYATMLQEKYNSTYFENRYGFGKDNLILIKGDQPETDGPADRDEFQALYTYLRTHDLSDDRDYEGFQKLADVQSYIDFCCVNLYFGNMDFNEQKNIIYWRSNRPGKGACEDTLWRWGLYDLDLENLDYGYLETDLNTFSLETHYAGCAFREREMYQALRKNPQFCRDFVNTFMDLINTEFTLDHVREVYDAWGCTPAYWHRKEDWCEDYFPARNQKITEFLREEFALSPNPAALDLSTNNGDCTILLNTIRPLSTDTDSGEWTGNYFTDYPVTLQAIPAKGTHFVEWQIDGRSYSTEPMLDLTLHAGENHVAAIFAPSVPLQLTEGIEFQP